MREINHSNRFPSPDSLEHDSGEDSSDFEDQDLTPHQTEVQVVIEIFVQWLALEVKRDKWPRSTDTLIPAIAPYCVVKRYQKPNDVIQMMLQKVGIFWKSP